MTKAQENTALNNTKEIIQLRLEGLYGFAPSKKQIIPLEASYNYDSDLDLHYCESLGFRIGAVGYSYRIGQPLEKNEAYNA